jgi:hypothetical protein
MLKALGFFVSCGSDSDVGAAARAAAVLFSDDLPNCPWLALPELISNSLKDNACFQGQRVKEHESKGRALMVSRFRLTKCADTSHE